MSSSALAALIMVLLMLMVLGIVVGNGIWDMTQRDVSMSTPAPSSTTSITTTTVPAECLCIFDIDRTLTGKQQEMDRCKDNQIQDGIGDGAYGGGELTLSQLTQALGKTFCSKCYLGAISQGDATGDVERENLYDHLDENHKDYPLPENPMAWGASCQDQGKPLITNCPDGQKQTAVPNILHYYRETVGVNITDEQVFFFDDRKENIESFKETGYNAKQISCKTRDDAIDGIGLCGATTDEIARFSGFKLCEPADQPVSV